MLAKLPQELHACRLDISLFLAQQNVYFIQNLSWRWHEEIVLKGAQRCDVSKCQVVINFLVEKLDSSVIISTPEFFHSYQRLDILRYMSKVNTLFFSSLSVRDCRLLYSCLDVVFLGVKQVWQQWKTLEGKRERLRNIWTGRSVRRFLCERTRATSRRE